MVGSPRHQPRTRGHRRHDGDDRARSTLQVARTSASEVSAVNVAGAFPLDGLGDVTQDVLGYDLLRLEAGVIVPAGRARTAAAR